MALALYGQKGNKKNLSFVSRQNECTRNACASLPCVGTCAQARRPQPLTCRAWSGSTGRIKVRNTPYESVSRGRLEFYAEQHSFTRLLLTVELSLYLSCVRWKTWCGSFCTGLVCRRKCIRPRDLSRDGCGKAKLLVLLRIR